MRLEIKTDKTKNTAYLLFAWEAIEARPNLDPFESCLRTLEETGQVYTSDVHIKHHARRGIKAAAVKDYSIKNPEIFYEKKDENGKSRSLATRVEDLNIKTAEDILNKCLDLPLFGFVYAKPSSAKNVPGESFQKNGATNTIIRPTTFHEAKILSLGRNNAFPQKNKDTGEDKEASGSAITDVLEYGFFLALFEINLPALRENTKNHSYAPGDVDAWINLLASGLWRAYTTDRYPSATQRSQFANFILSWSPEKEEEINPTTIREIVHQGVITNLIEAKEVIETPLKKLLEGWQYTKKSETGRFDPKNTLAFL